MTETIAARGTVVGVFEDEKDAQDAIRELQADGFDETHIGIAAYKKDGTAEFTDASGKIAAAGAVVGLGTGAMWGLGIAAGILPGIGPAIAGGTLAAILSSAAVGAAAAGLGGALIGLGVADEDAEYYENELKAGRILVTVKAGDRADTARAILERFRWIEAGAPPVVHDPR
jgi:hypothetical protein